MSTRGYEEKKMTLYKRLLLVVAVLSLLAPAANARFKSLKSKNKINCNKNSSKVTLSFVPGAPNGTYLCNTKY
jgi:hypothetical protein